jgi:two-component system nitrate/nitrite response regulator NarL
LEKGLKQNRFSATLNVSARGGDMENKIRVTILDDHQSIVDGYVFRLSKIPQIEIVNTLAFGEQLEPALQERTTDVLILDVHVPVSVENPNPHAILHIIPDLLQRYPDLHILVISMYNERSMIRAILESGSSGYILKDDHKSLQELGSIILSIANGGIYLSEKAYNIYMKNRSATAEEPLTGRQMEVLSLCAAYPDKSTFDIAQMMKVAHSTVRNLLSGVYLRLGVHNRAAAVAKAQQMGMITPVSPPLKVKM